MTRLEIQEAKRKLEQARYKQRLLRKEIDRLRRTLIEAGVDPDAPKVDLVPRNRKIFRQWKQGKPFKDIAVVFGLSTTTISSVCKRVESILERKRPGYNRYKNLLKYLSKRRGQPK